jgi:hypothetical protein
MLVPGNGLSLAAAAVLARAGCFAKAESRKGWAALGPPVQQVVGNPPAFAGLPWNSVRTAATGAAIAFLAGVDRRQAPRRAVELYSLGQPRRRADATLYANERFVG